MKLSISAIPKFSEGGSQLCLPIVLFLESDESEEKFIENWASSCFPFQENRDWGNPQDIITQHSRYSQQLLSPIKEIGYYYLDDRSLTLDRELFSHYLLAGCKLNKALLRLLKNAEFELIGLDKFQLSTLLEGGKDTFFKIKNSSNILELSEKLRKFNNKK